MHSVTRGGRVFRGMRGDARGSLPGSRGMSGPPREENRGGMRGESGRIFRGRGRGFRGREEREYHD